MRAKLICAMVLAFAVHSMAQNKPDIQWVSIPAGTFTMGSPDNEFGRESGETQHSVKMSAFRMSKHEITFDQYDLFCDATGRVKPDDAGWGRGNRPVINVTWLDARAFAEWMNCKLPSEAEWEYACRAGTAAPFNTGENLATSQGNYDGTYPYNDHPAGEALGKTIPVGSFQPNGWGLYDMHGNVWEWCNDWLAKYSLTPRSDPAGASSGHLRIGRGGSWQSGAQRCRSAYRFARNPTFKSNIMGFRLVAVE